MKKEKAEQLEKVETSQPDQTTAKALEQLLKERTDDLQRLRADFENYRKQTEKQKEESRKYAEELTVAKILPLLDDLDRAFQAYAELKPLQKTLDKTLSELDLAKIDTAAGIEFNPEIHDAVTAEGEGEQETVAETLRPGYYYKGAVLRPVMVKVARS